MSATEPRVFRATYSSTDVYECSMNDSPIMRRCKDDWVNATQILKCCNFPKAKRTKILEKGVQQGLHEKVQGGFGRFQGTWIPLPDAQRLASMYGVTPEAAPVLFLNLEDPNLVIPQKVKPQPKEPSSSKRKYTKKPKKPEDNKKSKADENGHDISSLSRQSSYLSQGTSSHSQVIPSQPQLLHQQQPPHIQFQIPSNNAIMKMQPPPMSTFTQQPQSSHQQHQQEYIPINGNMSANGMTNIPNFSPHNQAVQNDFQNYQMQFQRMQTQKQHQQHQQHQHSVKFYPNGPNSNVPNVYSQTPLASQMMGNFQHSSKPSSNENWSQDELVNTQKDSDTSVSTNDDPKLIHNGMNDSMTADITQSPKSSQEENTYSAQLLKFFSEDNAQIPYFIHNPPYNFNINEAIDDEGHTPLHWAASIGNYSMIHLLLSKGASPLVVNSFGLNPLSKLISFNNCSELKNFPKVLDDLELCLINTDINGRTPLHYLCQYSKVKSKYESLRYYMNIILNKLTSMSNYNPSKQIDLLKNVLDHQDVNGDTCLHLAARFSSAKLAKLLLQYGARDDLENIDKETARMLIEHSNLFSTNSTSSSANNSQRGLLASALPTIYHGQRSQLALPAQYPAVGLNYSAPVPKHELDGQYQVLATPMQTVMNGIETPDTQRTMIQDDDMDEEDITTERVDKKQIEHLIKAEDNKENIFVDGKGYNAVSTPISKTHQNSSASSHQPLAVISERTVESTPIQDKKFQLSTIHQAYKPQPPKLDEDGNIIEDKVKNKLEENVDVKLSMLDLSSMITGMINSLSDSYNNEFQKYEGKISELEGQLKSKQKANDDSTQYFSKMLGRVGIEQFSSVEEGKRMLTDAINLHEEEIHSKEQSLARVLERNQAYQLATLVEKHEIELMDKGESVEELELIDQNKIDYAVELTKMQIKRNNLVSKLTQGIKTFGIDSKMYKYRKLISLSCGLKVEDIDSLIDGIEESLVENMS